MCEGAACARAAHIGTKARPRFRHIDGRETRAANLLQLDDRPASVAVGPREEEGGNGAAVLTVASETLGSISAAEGAAYRGGDDEARPGQVDLGVPFTRPPAVSIRVVRKPQREVLEVCVL